MLTTIKRSALVMYSAQQMFDLVNDVASYPLYMDNCVGAEILEQNKHSMVARLDFKKVVLATALQPVTLLRSPSELI